MVQSTRWRPLAFSAALLLLAIAASMAARQTGHQVANPGPTAIQQPPLATETPVVRVQSTPTSVGTALATLTRTALPLTDRPSATARPGFLLTPPDVPPTPPAPPGVPPVPLTPPDIPPGPIRDDLVAGPLNGLATPRGLALRRPLAIMVENYAPDARPQTGLLAASVVFETVAEYGITRFMAVYQEQDAAVVGPVRSARVYYDHWAEGLQAIFVHAGGNSDAVRELWVLPNLVNVDEVATERGLYDTGATYFVRSSARYAPHNLYAYPAALRAHVATLSTWTSGPSPWRLAHKAELPLAQRPSGGTIDMVFSGLAYAVHYDYDRATNSYLRTMGGEAHTDAVSGQRIAPQNVALLIAGVSPDYSSDTLGSIIVQSEGQGTAYYFMDGTVRQGLWRKDGVQNPLQLLDTAGNPVHFNPGQTWVEVVPQGNSVSWTARQVR